MMDFTHTDYKTEIEKIENAYDYAKKLQRRISAVVNKIIKQKGAKNIRTVMTFNDLVYDLHENYREAVTSALRIACKDNSV